MHKIYLAKTKMGGHGFHGVALADDGETLAHAQSELPENIHPELASRHDIYDKHFGAGNWELEWVENVMQHQGWHNAVKLLKRDRLKT